jgi:hypothetical protein
MTDQDTSTKMPQHVAAIAACGYAIWAGENINARLRDKFDSERIPVAGVRNIRIWGLQVDDERELPGHERTEIPDEETWEINLVASDGSRFGFDSSLLKAAP